MNTFDIPWDLSQPTTFSQLADDDFLALLQKQFPTANGGLNMAGAFNSNGNSNSGAVNPQNLSGLQFGLNNNSSSADTSPSPTSTTEPARRAQSHSRNADEDGYGGHDSALKRKASDDDFDEGPGSSKKSGSKRRASNANGERDDSRLQKRKEQNRAAQRAFRERKEKHVKDLEDKVAALEAKNDEATSENSNLRELLQRLQSENMALKAQQSSFTFSAPKSQASPPSNGFAPGAFNSDPMMFSRSPSSFSSASSSFSPSNPLDFSSLQAFDPSVLNLLDEPPQPQPTATSSAMNMDFNFGGGGPDDNNSKNNFLNNYTVIANNPQFLSLASMFDESPPAGSAVSPPSMQSQSQQSPPEANPFNFDLSSLTSWPRDSGAGDLDDIFSGFNPMDLGGYGDTPGSGSSAISPVVHHEPPNGLISMTNHSPASSSPESHKSDSMFTPIESSSESEVEAENHECPKTRSEFVERINKEGQSPFTASAEKNDSDSCAVGAPALSASLTRKKGDASHVACQTGSTFPKTDKSPQNIEVLNAWKKITAAPGFKEADINELCSEFSKKARCDGTHVVLEPAGVQDILQTMQQKNRMNV